MSFPVDRSAIQQVEPAEKVVEKNSVGSPTKQNSGNNQEKRRSMGIDNLGSKGISYDSIDSERGMMLPPPRKNIKQASATLPGNRSRQSRSIPDNISTSVPPVPKHSNRESNNNDESYSKSY